DAAAARRHAAAEPGVVAHAGADGGADGRVALQLGHGGALRGRDAGERHGAEQGGGGPQPAGGRKRWHVTLRLLKRETRGRGRGLLHPRPGRQSRVTVPLRVTLWPFGPVTVPVWVQVPPEHEVLPVRLVVPRGPVKVCRELQVPPPQEPDPVELQELPRGPIPPPERDHPAPASDTPAAISASPRQAGPI